MTSKIYILILLNYIDVLSSSHDQSNRVDHIIQDPFLPQGYKKQYHLYGIKDLNGALTATAISVIGPKRSTNSDNIQDDDFFNQHLTRRNVPIISLHDEDPAERYLKSQEEKRKRSCFLSCILRCLGLDA